MILKYRPNKSIIAITFSEIIERQLALVWGVEPILEKKAHSTDEMLETAVDASLNTGLVERGSKIIITAGVPVGESGTTNRMKIHVSGDIIAKGQGIGRRTAYGRAVTAKPAEDANKRVKEGDIFVTMRTEREMMPAIERASGV